VRWLLRRARTRPVFPAPKTSFSGKGVNKGVRLDTCACRFRIVPYLTVNLPRQANPPVGACWLPESYAMAFFDERGPAQHRLCARSARAVVHLASEGKSLTASLSCVVRLRDLTQRVYGYPKALAVFGERTDVATGRFVMVVKLEQCVRPCDRTAFDPICF
jgi:hypothetical protein